MININFTVGAVVRLLREQKKVKQKDFSELNRVSLNKIEKGRIRNPSSETLDYIATRLNTTAHEIFEFVERLNSLSAVEPIDIDRKRLSSMMGELLDAGGKWSETVRLHIESVHEKFIKTQKEEEAKKHAKAG